MSQLTKALVLIAGVFLANVQYSRQKEYTCTVSTAETDKDSSSDDLKKILQQLKTASSVSAGHVSGSCTNIKKKWPNSPSGYYNIVNSLGQTMTVYCQMDSMCGSDGPWTRIAYLDMSHPGQKCPGSLREYGADGVRVCGRPVSTTGSCTSVYFNTPADSYSQVCGRVTGYQFATPTAVDGQSGRSIDTFYVDGVSLTKGSPRQHVWTFMAGQLERNAPTNLACPCGTSTQTSPTFVGSHYFCESGSIGPDYPWILYTHDRLWDGKSCGASETACCSVPGIPWFYRNFTEPSTDYLEMRVCCDQYTGNEDAPISQYEIYVQ